MDFPLFHISEEPDIQYFEPRPAPDPSSGVEGLMVWAIDEAHLHNYLLPRDCPRVTFYALPESKTSDVEKLMAGSSASYVVAIESVWFSRVMQQVIYLYEFSDETFVPLDKGAGYYISRETVVPHSVTRIGNLPEEMFRRNVELRIMPSLWKLRDAVAYSTLQFSIIRMRNAQARERLEFE